MKTSQLITIQHCTSLITTRLTLSPPSSHCLLTKKKEFVTSDGFIVWNNVSIKTETPQLVYRSVFTLCVRGYYTEEIRRKVTVLELFSWKMCNTEIHVSQMSCKMQENLLVLQKGQFSCMLSEMKTSVVMFLCFFTPQKKNPVTVRVCGMSRLSVEVEDPNADNGRQ